MNVQNENRVAVSGAGGFIGAALVRSLRAAGWTVERLVRRSAGPGEISWDPERGKIESAKLENLAAVVHLAGETIAGIWTSVRKRRILDSRSRGTRVIAAAIAGLDRPPGIFVSASGVDYYGDTGDEVVTERHPPGDSFLARVCVAWEGATQPARDAGIRVVNTRFGLVMHPSGGVLKPMLLPFRLGLGARLGDGQQWLSWVSLSDAVGIVRFAIENRELAGAVNATSPEPVRNAEFTRIVARFLDRPSFLVVPSVALKTLAGQMGEELLLSSHRVLPETLTGCGYRFRYRHLGEALRAGVD